MCVCAYVCVCQCVCAHVCVPMCVYSCVYVLYIVLLSGMNMCHCSSCYHVQTLELELLKANQKLAVGASEHAQEMKEQAAQLDKCRVSQG